MNSHHQLSAELPGARLRSVVARLVCATAAISAMVAWPTSPASALPLPGVTMVASYGGSQFTASELPVGGSFEYLVNYTCATQNCLDYSISIPIPAGVVVGEPSYGSDITSYSRIGSTATGTTLTFVMVALVAPGTSGQFTVPASTPAFITADNTVFTAVATMSSTAADAPTSTSAVVTLTARADITLRTVATKRIGGVLNDVTRYRSEGCLDQVEPINVWGLLGTAPNSTMVASLPVGAVVVDAAGGVLATGNPNTLTWTLPARADKFCGAIDISVRFPDSDSSNVVGASKTFAISWTATEVGKSPAAYPASVTHTLEAPSGPPAGAIFTTRLNTPRGVAPTQTAAVGDAVSIETSVFNFGTSTMTTAVVEAPVPTIVRPTGISSGNAGTSASTVELKTTCGPDRAGGTSDDNTWEPAASVNAGGSISWNPSTQWPNGSPAIGATCHVVSVRVTINGLAPGSSTNPVSFGGTIHATDRNGVTTKEGDSFTSTPTLVATTLAGSASRSHPLVGTVDLPKSRLAVRNFGPGVLSPGITEGNLTLLFNNYDNPLLNPVMTSLLPLNTSLMNWSGGGWSGAPTPTKTEIADWAGSGRTLVRWTFPSGTIVPVNLGYTINYRVSLSPFAYGTLRAAGRVDSAATSVLCLEDFFGAGVDTNDFDGDGNTTEQTCRWDGEVSPSPAASAAVTSKVKGTYNTAFVANPTAGQSAPGANDFYQITITNNGRIELDNVNVIDVLPRPGDTNILTTATRNPATRTFPVVLRATPVVPSLTTAPIVYYSTQTASCQPELGYSPSGCTAPGWTDWSITPPVALAAVTMVRVDFGTNILKPGFSYTLDLPVTTPTTGANEPDFASVNTAPLANADEIATNSAAFRARRVDNQSLLNAAEPPGVALRMPGILGPLSAPPVPGPIATSGVGIAAHTSSVAVPAAGSVHLLDGSTPVTTLTVGGIGTHQVDAATGQLTFTPALGYQGTAPGVAFRVTDGYGQAGDNVWTATVSSPAAPVATARVSTGVGTNHQTITLPIPSVGSVRLLDGTSPATSLTVTGEGVYTVDPTSGVVTFAPLLGFHGTATSISYRITDAYGQTAMATYTATVTKPAPPTAPSLTSSSTISAPFASQNETSPIPAGGAASLVDATDSPATTVTVAGQGTYVLDPSTGTITFTPLSGYRGTINPVMVRLTDAYGQAATGSYQPSIPASVPTTTTPAPPGATTTTTTTPPGATTPTTTAPAGADGNVSGIVWFDKNRNGRFDDGERVLAGVTVVLTTANGNVTGAAARLGVRGETAVIRRTATTGADGSYRFGGLEIGRYDITAAISITGFVYTSDTDGAADWSVQVAVAAAQNTMADFAGSGLGTITGNVIDAISSQGMVGATVQCRWSGFDAEIGTSDDITFDTIAGPDGSFAVQGVPYGTFACVGIDTTNNLQSAAATLTIENATPMAAQLPIGDVPTPLGPPPNSTLAAAGSASQTPLKLAGLSLLVGATALLIGKRRPAEL